MSRNYTVKFPLEMNSKEETFDTLGNDSIIDVINHNIKSTILTHRGERRSDPLFGCGAKKYLFEYNTTQINDLDALTGDIQSQVKQYVPYIIIDDISVTPSEGNLNAIQITLQYTVPNIKKAARFSLIISE